MSNILSGHSDLPIGTNSNSNQPLPEEVKQKAWPLLGYAPGNYMNKCVSCRTEMQMVDKLCFQCWECAARKANEIMDEAVKELAKYKEQIAALKATIADYDKKLIESRQEGERLRGLIKIAWEDGWRIRNNTCGLSKAMILKKKFEGYEIFKQKKH